MIISFTIKNFRSYKDEAEFSFEAVDSNFNSENVTSIQLEDGEEVRLLKSAAIFGGNASGKSNTIWALYVLSNLVAH
jgi:AAA15 family ATPase/GTPase